MSRVFQVVSIFMLAWFALTWLSGLHVILGTLLFLFALANSVTAWMLRYSPTSLNSVMKFGFGANYIRFVGRWTGDKAPAGEKRERSGILLGDAQAFENAAKQACQLVRGHDTVIRQMFSRIQESLTLQRRQRKRSSSRPLASFLLAGPDGVGKRYLACVVAKLLYGDERFEVFDCAGASATSLCGQVGEVLKREPRRIVMFENVDRAPADVAQMISSLVDRGRFDSHSDDSTLELRHTLVVLSMSKDDEFFAEANRGSTPAAWQQLAIDHLSADVQIPLVLLNGLAEIFYCHRPADEVRSEVVALIMANECRVHRTELIRADPEIIAALTFQVDDDRGFALAPQVIKKLLRKPLLAATVADQKAISLRVRMTPTNTD